VDLLAAWAAGTIVIYAIALLVWAVVAIRRRRKIGQPG
jgi:hypothetical protein